MKAHYRSTLASEYNMTLPGTSVDASTTVFRARFMNSQPFWSAPGGAQSLDESTGVPTFQDDIILRGGMLNLTVNNFLDDTTADVRVKVYLFKSDETPIYAFAPTVTTQPREWDPSMFPDSHRRLGRILMSRQALLKPGDSLNTSFRMRVEKIDQQDYLNNNRELWWMVVACTNNAGGGTDTIKIIPSFNLSFSGDVVDV